MDVKKLELVQKRATKLILEISKKPHSTQRTVTGPKFVHIEVHAISWGI